MKKILAVIMCAMLVSACAVSASAYESPNIHPGSDTDSNIGGGGDGDDSKKSSDSDGSTSSKGTGSTSSTTSSTSPKTGSPVSYGVLMAAAALAFGGVAAASRKKIEEN